MFKVTDYAALIGFQLQHPQDAFKRVTTDNFSCKRVSSGVFVYFPALRFFRSLSDWSIIFNKLQNSPWRPGNKDSTSHFFRVMTDCP